MENKIEKLLNYRLQTLREFQEKYPESHVGGSIGLYLLGYDLKRSLSKSDLDIITNNFQKDDKLKDFFERSDSNDFNLCYQKDFGGYFVKIDISVKDDKEYTVIEHIDGFKYNVSKFENIIKFKQEYANKGVYKHKNDLIVIETGVRPLETDEETSLPF